MRVFSVSHLNLKYLLLLESPTGEAGRQGSEEMGFPSSSFKQNQLP